MTIDPPLYIDNHLLVLFKPAGLLIQGDRTGDPSLHELARQYLKQSFHKPGNVFLGLVHRLDRPVSGVVVFARTSKAAGRLSTQFRQKQVKKTYWALVEGNPPDEAILSDRIRRNGVTSVIDATAAGKAARLSYRLLKQFQACALLEIDLDTGRHHQIRLQLSNFGFPILGDFRYGSNKPFPKRAVALHARSLALKHPVRNEYLTFSAPLEPHWPQPVKHWLAQITADSAR